jgi:hypothetical protein
MRRRDAVRLEGRPDRRGRRRVECARDEVRDDARLANLLVADEDDFHWQLIGAAV